MILIEIYESYECIRKKCNVLNFAMEFYRKNKCDLWEDWKWLKITIFNLTSISVSFYLKYNSGKIIFFIFNKLEYNDFCG